MSICEDARTAELEAERVAERMAEHGYQAEHPPPQTAERATSNAKVSWVKPSCCLGLMLIMKS